MTRPLPWLALASGCAGAPAPPEVGPPLAVDAWLDGRPSCAGGALVVQATFDARGTVALDDPEVGGLDFVALGEPRTESLGPRVALTARYRFSGEQGSYEITGITATWSGPDGPVTADADPLWVDLCVEPPRGELVDISDPPALWAVPWAAVGAVGGVAALMLGGVWFAFRRPAGPASPPGREDPPDVRALREWDAVRADQTLTDLERAKAISRIFRVYAEVVLGFPATAWTTTEVVGHLAGLAHLPDGNVPRARRLLRATDRVKFAEQRPGEDAVAELDADLRAFVGSTRPRTWSPS